MIRIWTDVVNEHVAVVRMEYAKQTWTALDGYEFELVPLEGCDEDVVLDQLHYEIGKRGSAAA